MNKREKIIWASQEMKELNEIEAGLSCRKLRLARVLSEIAGDGPPTGDGLPPNDPL